MDKSVQGEWRPQLVQLHTSMGDLTLELYWTESPVTCLNFATLADRGYYNGTVFHRVIRDFMVQGGDPTGTGRGGESIYTDEHGGRKFKDEIRGSPLRHTGAGVLSMANSGPDSNGSQFFVTLGPASWLDGKHTVFGRVYAGMGVLQRMGSVVTDGQDRPVEEVEVREARCVMNPALLKKKK
eukprot:Nk52_evm1s767 gene=Nk52_evmTU1s767